MSAPSGNDLPRRLTELFEQRAASVTHARRVELDVEDSDREATGAQPVRLGRHRESLGLLAAAAAVFVAIAGTVLGIQASRHQQPPTGLATGSRSVSSPAPTSTPSSTRCAVAAPPSWREAIQAGALPAQLSPTRVISANGGTGDYLALQGSAPSRLSLAVFHGGSGRTIFSSDGASGILLADPTGAVSAGWVAFAMVGQQDTNYHYRVLLYNRATQQTRVLAGQEPPDSQVKHVSGSPVIAAGKVYWLATYDNRHETTTLESWDLARGVAGDPVPAANAFWLVPYGSGVALFRRVGTGTGLSNGAGAPLAKAQLAATVGGSNFGFDGVDKLSWLRVDDHGTVGYSYLVVGSTAVSHQRPMRQFAGLALAIYPFTVAHVADWPNNVLDLRTGTAVLLPAGVGLQAVVGDKVIFGTGSTESGATGLSLVPLSALPAVRC